MRILFAFLMILTLTTWGFSQSRELPHARFQQLEPQLFEFESLHLAAGVAQAPQGWAIPLSNVVPAGSLVSIYAKNLQGSDVKRVLLSVEGREFVVSASTWPVGWFGMETLNLRLPSDIHGEVLIRGIGESRNSNQVRILVE